ncbi:MAG: hypothetical protein LC749_12395 [Actinobacteria bacterium]|nr:hypothetical protein [Actinomycetota bacterium]
MLDQALERTCAWSKSRMLLAKIDAGELETGLGAVRYLRGALATLDAVLGGRPMELPAV